MRVQLGSIEGWKLVTVIGVYEDDGEFEVVRIPLKLAIKALTELGLSSTKMDAKMPDKRWAFFYEITPTDMVFHRKKIK